MHFLCVFLLLVNSLHFIQCAENIQEFVQQQSFCNDVRCVTCIGKQCFSTCRGADCEQCPLGECCNGVNCKMCRGTKCCSEPDCNKCVQDCLKIDCYSGPNTKTCHSVCFKKCLPESEQDESKSKKNINYPEINIKNQHVYLPVNVTTVINITNNIMNDNYLRTAPIVVNHLNNRTSKNKKSHQHHHYHHSVPVANNVGIPEGCCNVIHPENCTIQNYSGKNFTICTMRKHQECSDNCISKNIQIVENLNSTTNRCINDQANTYSYCGKYEIQDCNNCYNCTSGEDCLTSNECPEICKESILEEYLYNIKYRKEK